jgi:hypothetical protein
MESRWTTAKQPLPAASTLGRSPGSKTAATVGDGGADEANMERSGRKGARKLGGFSQRPLNAAGEALLRNAPPRKSVSSMRRL